MTVLLQYAVKSTVYLWLGVFDVRAVIIFSSIAPYLPGGGISALRLFGCSSRTDNIRGSCDCIPPTISRPFFML